MLKSCYGFASKQISPVMKPNYVFILQDVFLFLNLEMEI